MLHGHTIDSSLKATAVDEQTIFVLDEEEEQEKEEEEEEEEPSEQNRPPEVGMETCGEAGCPLDAEQT